MTNIKYIIHVQFSENNSEKGNLLIKLSKKYKAFGDDGVEETLLPIPNRKVKLYSVNGTARGTVWESRTLPSN